MGRFAQEMVKLWGASRKNGFNKVGASRKNGRKKSLIEGGTGMAPRMPVPPSMSDFSDHSCAKLQLC